jgi:hypothetical protein
MEARCLITLNYRAKFSASVLGTITHFGQVKSRYLFMLRRSIEKFGAVCPIFEPIAHGQKAK